MEQLEFTLVIEGCFHDDMQVGILSRVLEEVDKIVQEFKEMLFKKMEDPHVEIAQVRSLVV